MTLESFLVLMIVAGCRQQKIIPKIYDRNQFILFYDLLPTVKEFLEMDLPSHYLCCDSNL
ncbi:CLUMA_CG008825, isoform A [Clunio marinus]|uniref:CLUMA_CG008825, isoform A n=1 Tax=Clunio marinus TaxID=568069 RepID=A0A1J1I637_9DIPT|nr:CLUMA_CG008825, isoform A [Clunio marinus]